MPAFIQGLSSCALQEICMLSSHPSAHEAMLRFCKQAIGDRTEDMEKNSGYNLSYVARGDNKGKYTEGLGDAYVFHGVEGKGDGYSKVNYASCFADFILENKLGEVAAGQAVINHRYHPDHKTQAFIWNPDRKAVFKWWNANRPQPQKPIVIVDPSGGVANIIAEEK